MREFNLFAKDKPHISSFVKLNISFGNLTSPLYFKMSEYAANEESRDIWCRIFGLYLFEDMYQYWSNMYCNDKCFS